MDTQDNKGNQDKSSNPLADDFSIEIELSPEEEAELIEKGRTRGVRAARLYMEGYRKGFYAEVNALLGQFDEDLSEGHEEGISS